ncbi:threonine ammonia-lyase [Nocardioides bizhenqiangii]|uniref:threonine ammonia-lyase n=1 Tax=Nocardioides bizhenqiangii TaxID=3095076 RepID=A0ABZ0ZTI8_9ACTN|nr:MULTISPECIES: threonine ammonia-lyase [unclassified Nocardioides]MDZ5621777.1 threonine ammonia-lyase [Nocardioides sp. HM23]WQQ27537.1 threonine ammonia-lyase [Nocardioides sp. HM61]
MPEPTVTLADIQAARPLVEAVAVRTPMLESRWLSGLTGVPVHLKCENLQRTGSFKVRGAAVRIARLSEEERARGVVAASAGNHAQGVALAAQRHGIAATVFMPDGAPIPKERATRGYGADVRFASGVLEDCLAAATEFAEQTGAALIHPFDHHDIVSGQGTLGLEIIEQVPDAATVVVPTGGGGLLGGVAIAVKALRPDVRLVGVQAAGAAAYPPSLAEGHPVRLSQMATMADGIAVGQPGELTFRLVREYVDDLLTVSEEALSRALVALVEREKLVVEPAGAAAAAALCEEPNRFTGPVVVVLSGGNVDPLLLGKVIRHGMAAARRYLNLQVTLADVPGGLARLLTQIGEAGANVIEVAHERISPSLLLDEVDVHLQLETRGEPHAEAVIARLREHGYTVLDRG